MTAEKAAGRERTAEQIRDDIGTTRAAIVLLAQDLDHRIQRALDWRTRVSRHPLAVVLVAAGAGTAAVLMVRRTRRTPWQKVAESVAETVQDLRWQLAESFEGMAASARGRSSRSRLADPLTARVAVSATIAKATLDFLRERMAQSYQEARTRSASAEG